MYVGTILQRNEPHPRKLRVLGFGLDGGASGAYGTAKHKRRGLADENGERRMAVRLAWVTPARNWWRAGRLELSLSYHLMEAIDTYDPEHGLNLRRTCQIFLEAPPLDVMVSTINATPTSIASLC